jgi:hypothetical protein
MLLKFNLTQAEVLDSAGSELQNSGGLKGGMVEVQLRIIKTQAPIQMPRWVDFLAGAVKRNFEVEGPYNFKLAHLSTFHPRTSILRATNSSSLAHPCRLSLAPSLSCSLALSQRFSVRRVGSSATRRPRWFSTASC